MASRFSVTVRWTMAGVRAVVRAGIMAVMMAVIMAREAP
jgi:hypothetical protein